MTVKLKSVQRVLDQAAALSNVEAEATSILDGVERDCFRLLGVLAKVSDRDLRAEMTEEIIGTLSALLGRLETPETGAQQQPKNTGNDLPAPTHAVKQLLTLFPEGLTRLEMIARLDGRFQTTSPEPKKLLKSVVNNLWRDGHLLRSNEGVYTLNHQKPQNKSYLGIFAKPNTPEKGT